MIVCFEGPSAVGKSSLGKLLSDQHLIVPEVNLLFKGETPNSKFWYYKKQIERYQICLKTNQLSILDGDPFQPLWYNWIYGFPKQFPNFEETATFYAKQISLEQLRFPDLYIIFETSLDNLYQRKERDKFRKRRNFEKHLKLIEPQKKYFKFLQEETTVEVKFVDLMDLQTAREEVLALIEATKKQEQNPSDVFEKIKNWIIFTKDQNLSND